jgi:hypothetical protein
MYYSKWDLDIYNRVLYFKVKREEKQFNPVLLKFGSCAG